MKTIHMVVIEAFLRHCNVSSKASSIIITGAWREYSITSAGERRQQHQAHAANMGTKAKIIKILMRAIKPDSVLMAFDKKPNRKRKLINFTHNIKRLNKILLSNVKQNKLLCSFKLTFVANSIIVKFEWINCLTWPRIK